MSKLIIQIPCFNEAETLAVTLNDLPRELQGVDRVEWLIVDDGSTDATVEVAQLHGVDHIVRLPENQGLSRAFMAGITHSLAAGADIIVNTDADNQYNAEDIPRLIDPIVNGSAQIVIGARPIAETDEFSRTKKFLQRLGSWAVRVASGTNVPDAPSGFRAIARDAALKLNVFNTQTYTLETIIQAGRLNIPITSVPVRTNPSLRPSRLIKSLPSYVGRSALTIFRIFLLYKPLRTFALIGAIFFTSGFALGVRWLILFYFDDPLRTHVPSLILAAILSIAGMLCWIVGLIGDLLSVNRQVLEEVQVTVRELKLQSSQVNAKAPVPGTENARTGVGEGGS